MLHVFSKNRRFFALLALYIAAVLLQMALLPPFEGGDEMLHFNYTGWILENGSLPDRNTADENAVRQASGQPPSYYAIAALVARLLNLPQVDGDALYTEMETIGTIKNGWYAPPDQWNQTDNRNLYLVSLDPEMADGTSYAEAVPSLHVLRFVSLAFGLIGVIGAYGAAGEVFRSSLWRIVATALFALTPQYVHMSAIFHNDIAPYALAAVVIWLALRMMRTGASYPLLITTGILLALAGLAKINALLIAPGVMLAAIYAIRNRSLALTELLPKLATLAIAVAAIILPWALWGQTHYDDPLGTETHLRSGYFYRWPLLLTETMPLMPEAYLGYWGKLASAVYLQPIFYVLLSSLLVLSILGYWFGRHFDWRRGKLREQQFAICALILLVSALGAFQWLRTIHFVTGRLLYPAHLPIMLAVAGGLALLARRIGHPRTIAGYTGSVLVAAAFIGVPLGLLAAYSPPSNQQVNVVLEGPQYDFDNTIRFLGFQREDALIHEPLTRMTLCWEVLAETERSAAFSIKFQNGADQVADRTSVFGMGRYPSSLWTPGIQFCDQVDIPLTAEPISGQSYNMILVALDAATGAVDWQATALDGTPVEYPFLGTVALP